MPPPTRSPFSGLPRALHLTEPRGDFGVVLGAIVVAVIFQLAAPETDVSRFVAVVIQGSVVVIALRAAGSRHHVLTITAGIMAAAAIAAALALFIGGAVAPIGPRLITLILILLTPAAVIAGVVRELREDGAVTIQTVYCGLCLYLLLGMAFAFAFGAIEDVGNPFFAHGVAGSPNDFLYFSLATLTTTGYGDFSAATELGRAISVTEALIGQMYLVTVLAVIVSNLTRRPRS